MSSRVEKIPIYELFRKQTSIDLTEYFLKQDHSRWIRKSEIQDETTVNHESIRRNVGSGNTPGILENFGIVERSSWEKDMPRHRVCKSPVVDFLREYDGTPLDELFTSTPRYELFMFFYQQDHGDNTYTRSGLSNSLGISYNTVDEMMEHMNNIGMLEADDNGYSVEYKHIPDNQVEQNVATLNSLLFEEFSKQLDNYPDDVQI